MTTTSNRYWILLACLIGPINARAQEACSDTTRGAALVALVQVHGARIYAETEERRLALAKVETLLMKVIDTFPNHVIIWKNFDAMEVRALGEDVQRRRDADSSMAAYRMSFGRNPALEDSHVKWLTDWYRHYTDGVLFAVRKYSCREKAWQEIYAAALDADSR